MNVTYESRITSGGLSVLIDGPFKVKEDAKQSARDRWEEDQTRHIQVIEIKKHVVFSITPVD